MKKSTWIVLGVFILLLAGFLLVQKIGEKPAEDDTPTSTPVPALRSIDSQALISIKYQDAAGERIQVDRIDALEWTISTHPEGQITAGNVEEILSNLSDLSLISTLADPPSLDEIGLDNPEIILEFTFDNGEIYLIEIGQLTTLNDGYYARIDNSNAIVILPKSSIDQVALTITNATIPPTPTLDQNATPTATPSPASETGE